MSIGVFTRPVNRGDGRVNADEIRGNDNALGQALNTLDATVTALAASAITGPGSSTDNAVVRWNGVGGAAIQDSAVVISDAGGLTVTSTTTPQAVVQYNASNRLDLSVSSTGAVTFNAVGSGAAFNFQDNVSLNDATLTVNANDRVSPVVMFSDSSTGAMTMMGLTASSSRASGTTSLIATVVATANVVTGASTVTDLKTIVVNVAKSAAGATVTTGTGIDINAMTATMGTARALHINDVTGGGTNYAIYTNAGTVRFGDVVNIATTNGLQVNGTKVVGARGAAVTAPTGGTVQDSEARTAINDLISRLQAHGLIA